MLWAIYWHFMWVFMEVFRGYYIYVKIFFFIDKKNEENIVLNLGLFEN